MTKTNGQIVKNQIYVLENVLKFPKIIIVAKYIIKIQKSFRNFHCNRERKHHFKD
jgi:hypothetical protein